MLGELAERLKAPDSKSGVPKGIGGSNPSLSANKIIKSGGFGGPPLRVSPARSSLRSGAIRRPACQQRPARSARPQTRLASRPSISSCTPVKDAPSPPQKGTRATAIQRAWTQEVELIRRAGRGTRLWSQREIDEIKAGANFEKLGYTGHHINMVKDFPAWQGDPRNITFLRPGKGEEHMAVGHPGGTRVSQPSSLLIDRESMLKSLRVAKGGK